MTYELWIILAGFAIIAILFVCGAFKYGSDG